MNIDQFALQIFSHRSMFKVRLDVVDNNDPTSLDEYSLNNVCR
jgi:hypothetical protein